MTPFRPSKSKSHQSLQLYPRAFSDINEHVKATALLRPVSKMRDQTKQSEASGSEGNIDGSRKKGEPN